MVHNLASSFSGNAISSADCSPTDGAATNWPHSSAVRGTPLGSSPELIYLPYSHCKVQPNISLAKFTSFRAGGPADRFAAPSTIEQLEECIHWAQHHGYPITFLGAGTNLLVSDRGVRGLVICTRRLRHAVLDRDSAQLTAAAGEPIARLAWQVAELGWRGLEWAAGIPGTVGGAVAMNAGAHRQATSDVFLSAQVLLPNGTSKQLSVDEMQFSYRTSILQQQHSIVTQATFQLCPDSTAQEVTAETRNFLNYRHTTQPYDLPSCGSVFRNPTDCRAGWLIEQTGLKGHQIGQAQVSQRHANFIVNLKQATAQNIFDLIGDVQQRVDDRWSVRLHPEVKILGEFQTH